MPMLNSSQANLYQRLQDFELDDPTHEFGFMRHLMRNQGWTLTYTQRVITEYKKFAFLTVVADHQVVPSDQVDQVWHAHVLLTQPYWEEFCPKVLGKALHHYPARGGRAERAKFHHLYVETITSYQHFFGSPPTDIWSPLDLRFGTELRMQRVNLSEHWVIPKRLPQLKLVQLLVTVSTLAFITAGCVNAGQESTFGEFARNLSANQFTTVLSLAMIFGLVLRHVIRSPGKQPQKPQLSVYQLAYLAGGSSRVVELAITQLVHQGYLRPNVLNRTFAIEKALPPGMTSLEEQVMRQVHRTPEFKKLRQASIYQTHFLKEQLEQEKLLMTGRAASIIGSCAFSFPMIPFVGSCAFSFLTIPFVVMLTIALHTNIIAALWLGVCIIHVCCTFHSGRTRWGKQILADIKKNHDVYNVTQRFALYGDRVLSGGALDDLKQIYKAEAAEVAAEVAAEPCGCGC